MGLMMVWGGLGEPHGGNPLSSRLLTTGCVWLKVRVDENLLGSLQPLNDNYCLKFERCVDYRKKYGED